jgi:hypothetical protein
MKKIIVIVSVFLLISTSLFAAYTYPNLFWDDVTFTPTSTRIEGMGGSGISTSNGLDSLYMNPANLASQKFSMYLPAVSITAYNVKNIIDSGIIQDIMDGNAGPTTAAKYLDTIEAAKGDLLTTDIATGFAGGGFALALNFQEQLHNIDTGSDTNVVIELNAAASVGLGINIGLVEDFLSVDVGATARPTYKAYTQKISGQGLFTTIMTDSENLANSLMEDNMLSAGYAIPVDVGVNINLPIGLRLSGVMRNLNGNYTMRDYSEAGAWVNEMLAFASQDPIYDDEAPTATVSGERTIVVPSTIDLGFGWSPDLGGLLSPTISIDLVDVEAMMAEMETNDQAFWNYMRAGAELKLLSIVNARFGINQGYMSLGAGFDLLLFHIDASYYWREYGQNIGDRPVDALSVRFNLGVDG